MNRKPSIHVLGLKDTGKSSFINIVQSYNLFTKDKINQNRVLVSVQGKDFIINEKDLDGITHIGNLGTDGVIFFIDLSDRMRYPEARMLLYRLIKTDQKKKYPISICLNKVDLISEDDFKEITLEMFQDQKKRRIRPFTTSIHSPEFFIQAFRWVIDEIAKNNLNSV